MTIIVACTTLVAGQNWQPHGVRAKSGYARNGFTLNLRESRKAAAKVFILRENSAYARNRFSGKLMNHVKARDQGVPRTVRFSVKLWSPVPYPAALLFHTNRWMADSPATVVLQGNISPVLDSCDCILFVHPLAQ